LKGFKKKVAEYEAQQKKDQETIGSQRTSIENLEKKVAQLEEETRVYRAQIETEQATNESKQKRIGELFQAIVEMKKTLASETETKEKIQAKLEEIERLRTQLEEFKESMPREYKMLFSTRIAYIQNNSLYVTDGDPQVSNRIQMRNFPLFDSSTVELRRPRISPDRKYVAVEYRDSSKDKWGIRLYEIIEFFDGDIGRGKKGLLRRIEFNEDLSELAWIDNTNIAFIAGEKKDELWIYNINSEKPTCLVKNETGIIGDIAATPTGKYIAYVVFSEYEGKNACQIWGITPQGENRTRISSREDKYNMQPSWIDESTLVYTREGRSYDSEVCLVRLGSPTVKQTYRSVTSNASFPRSIVARNSADYNPAANMEGLVIFTNESDGIVVRHPKKSLQSGLLDKPDDMPYEQEDVIASEATNRHCRAQFYEDGRSILVKIKNRLYRVKKVNGEYQRQFIAEADEESDFDIR
ncbi:hypothetical protein KY326_04530, partial [Candidatus Woesearchaeota archaeon]|nr:hypothetical protein [Candidatus Woesearchaeota archaeon]